MHKILTHCVKGGWNSRSAPARLRRKGREEADNDALKTILACVALPPSDSDAPVPAASTSASSAAAQGTTQSDTPPPPLNILPLRSQQLPGQVELGVEVFAGTFQDCRAW